MLRTSGGHGVDILPVEQHDLKADLTGKSSRCLELAVRHRAEYGRHRSRYCTLQHVA